MEDWQKWTRRTANATTKKPPQYLFFPNRTAGQTYFISFITGVAIMSLSYGLLKTTDESKKDLVRSFEAEINRRTCDINNENSAIIRKKEEENLIRRRRRYLRLNPKPAAAVIISDPEVLNDEKTGYIDVRSL